MAATDTKKEALFNEVKGSLFEYLVGREIAVRAGDELDFQRSLDAHYLTVLSQQDRMVRQFYPEMGAFLREVARLTTGEIGRYLGPGMTRPRLLGKFVNSSLGSVIREADLSVQLAGEERFLSLKLNKKNAYVNTKSAGIKSFFTQYFPFVSPGTQEDFSALVEMEFETMARELHAHRDLPYAGDFSLWVKAGHSELPGELAPEERLILKRYYARIARRMHEILASLSAQDPAGFQRSLRPLMGFGHSDVVQVICFHDMKAQAHPEIHIHELRCHDLSRARVLPFGDVASVEIELGGSSLQVRVKPMNKFTTTAIKINCSMKFSPTLP